MRSMLTESDMLTWPDFPECFLHNYNMGTIRKIRDNPRRWLCSLPMYEYAHVVVTTAWMRWGGELKPYYNDLFLNYISPILAKYQQKLEIYRAHLVILERNYASMKKLVTKTSVAKEACHMRTYAARTRAALRHAAAYFHDRQIGFANYTTVDEIMRAELMIEDE